MRGVTGEKDSKEYEITEKYSGILDRVMASGTEFRSLLSPFLSNVSMPHCKSISHPMLGY